MNILFICNEYPPGKNGGIGSVTRSLSGGLSAMGHHVFVAGLYAPGYGQGAYQEENGVKIWRRRFNIDKGFIKNNYSVTDTLLVQLLSVTGLLKKDTLKGVSRFNDFMLDLIKRYNIDIVEWPDYNEYFRNLGPSFTWPVLPVPLVIKFHGTESYLRKQLGEKVEPDMYQTEKKHFLRADALISVSKNTARNYQSFYDIKKEVKVLYNSIDIPPLPLRGTNTQTIVYIGALTKLKGIYSLLSAWNIVHLRHPGASLKIFGKGKMSPLLQQLKSGVRQSVSFEGFVNRDTLFDMLSKAAAAVFPSYTECFAVAPMEAMAVGCPVIYTTRVSGPELITDNENGLLIEPDDIAQIADAICLMLENDELQKKFSIAGRATIEKRFDIKVSAKNHSDFYSQVIDVYQKKQAVHV